MIHTQFSQILTTILFSMMNVSTLQVIYPRLLFIKQQYKFWKLRNHPHFVNSHSFRALVIYLSLYRNVLTVL